MSPHNMGKITPEELQEGEVLASGSVGNPSCGDLLTMYLRIKGDLIQDCKVETFGCASAIACSSVTTDMVIGKTIAEAKQITKKDAADALGGLPPIKMHCSNLAAEALHQAIANYEKGVEIVTKDQVNYPNKDDAVDSADQAKKVNKDMKIGEVVNQFPQAAPIMMEYGLHCIGCHVAAWESISQGASAHGLPDDKIDEMVEKINQAI